MTRRRLVAVVLTFAEGVLLRLRGRPRCRQAAGRIAVRRPGRRALSEANWKRSVRWTKAIEAIGVPDLRVHDLRHTAASLRLGAGADPKVVQRILRHASTEMTMDLYGHLIDQNLWDAAKRTNEAAARRASGGFRGSLRSHLNHRRTAFDQLLHASEPVTGVEPATSSLQAVPGRVRRDPVSTTQLHRVRHLRGRGCAGGAPFSAVNVA
jgi:hypothetical protein